MADDLAAKLARAFVIAAGRAAGKHAGGTIDATIGLLAEDLRRILSSDLPEWYAGYQAALEDGREADPVAEWRDQPVTRGDLSDALAGAVGAIRDHGELERAARALLHRLENMTTEQFAHGGERAERRALAVALGMDPDDHSGPAPGPLTPRCANCDKPMRMSGPCLVTGGSCVPGFRGDPS